MRGKIERERIKVFKKMREEIERDRKR